MLSIVFSQPTTDDGSSMHGSGQEDSKFVAQTHFKQMVAAINPTLIPKNADASQKPVISEEDRNHPLYAETAFIKYFQNYDRLEQPLSELFLRNIQSLILTIAFGYIQNRFSNHRFRFGANQKTPNTTKQPDNYISLKINEVDFPLLIGEDKPNVKNLSDIGKSSNVLRQETKAPMEQLLSKVEDCSDYTPLVYITNQFEFRLFEFQKVDSATKTVGEDGQLDVSYDTTGNILRWINLFTTGSTTYDLRNREHVYMAVVTIIHRLEKLILFLVSMKAKPFVRSVQIPPTPVKRITKRASYVMENFSLMSEPKSIYYKSVQHKENKVYRYETFAAPRTSKIVKYVTKDQHSNLCLAAQYCKNRVIPFESHELKDNEIWAIFMIEGDSLLRLIQFNDYEIQADRIFVQLLEAISTLHQNNFVHRDIKTPNLVIYNGNLYLIDFDDAFKFDRIDDDAAIVDEYPVIEYRGSPTFIAPEIADGDAYGPKIDCFGAGVVMMHFLAAKTHRYEEFKHRPAVLNEETVELFFQQHQELLKYKVLVTGLLQKDPKKRLSSIDAYNMMKQICEQHPTSQDNAEAKKSTVEANMSAADHQSNHKEHMSNLAGIQKPDKMRQRK